MSLHEDAAEPRLTIDLDALAANYRRLRDLAPAAKCAPVLKADAYGTGAGPAGRRLWSEGARTFFVARAAEGEALRGELGAERPARIYVLDGCPAGAAERLQAAGLIPVLNGLDQVEHWSAAARQGRAPAALHIDTGLNRLGLRPEEAKALAEAPGRLSRFDIDLVVSHLACGNVEHHPMNATQLAAFLEVAGAFPEAKRSLASSGGAFQGGPYALDMIRPGISLYGGGPFDRPDARIAPVATLDAPSCRSEPSAPASRWAMARPILWSGRYARRSSASATRTASCARQARKAMAGWVGDVAASWAASRWI